MLWMFQRVMFGKLDNPKIRSWRTCRPARSPSWCRCWSSIFLIGFYPNTFLEKMNPSLENLIQQVKAKQEIALMVEAPTPSVVKITVNE